MCEFHSILLSYTLVTGVTSYWEVNKPVLIKQFARQDGCRNSNAQLRTSPILMITLDLSGAQRCHKRGIDDRVMLV